MRLGTCEPANGVHVENTDENQGQGWNLCPDGIGLLVRSLPYAMSVSRLNQNKVLESVQLSGPYCSATVPLKQKRVGTGRKGRRKVPPYLKRSKYIDNSPRRFCPICSVGHVSPPRFKDIISFFAPFDSPLLTYPIVRQPRG